MDSGTISLTSLKACESVTTSAGASFKLLNASFNSVSRTTSAFKPLSRISLKVCTCGRIILPFGASLSIGITRTTVESGSTRSPRIEGGFIKLSGTDATSCFFSSKTTSRPDFMLVCCGSFT